MSQEVEGRIATQAVASMRAALTEGKPILVYGWHSSNHDDFTRSISGRHIRFERDEPKTVPNKVGFIITTRRVAGKAHKRLRDSGMPCYATPLTTGRIKSLLKEVESAIPTAHPAGKEKGMAPSTATSQRLSPSTRSPEQDEPAFQQLGVPDPSPAAPAPEPTREEREKAFAADFMKAVGGDPQKTLTRYQIGELLGRHFGDGTNRHASKYKDLLEPVTAGPNSRAGVYRASARLIELAGVTPEIEPTNALEKAHWLIAREPQLRARKEQLEAEQQSINERFEARKVEVLAELERERRREMSALSNEIGELGNQLLRCDKARKHLEGLEKL